jgi:hypothetical protein
LDRLPRDGADQLYEAAVEHSWFTKLLEVFADHPSAEQERVRDEARAGAIDLPRRAVDAGFHDNNSLREAWGDESGPNRVLGSGALG